jgi:hypothetical protein
VTARVTTHAADGGGQVIELFLGGLVVLVAVMSGRRWLQTRRSGGRSGGVGIEEAQAFRDERYASRRGNDGEDGTGRF